MPFDLSLATLQVIITTNVAYAACIVLGGVLLQTAPTSSFGMNNNINMGIGKGKGGVNSSIIPKGMSTGLEANMEAFWRVLREIERHEHVVSLPAPHVWQVCPPGQGDQAQTQGPGSRSRSPLSHPALSPSDSSSLSPNGGRTKAGGVDGSSVSPQLIITLSPHVPSSLSDEEVLKLTRWACERVKGAFGSDGQRGGHGHGVEVEVCVGILRG
jgi:hypothetical protein